MINIATDFSKFPAGRFREDGEHNGAAFRDDHLVIALRDPSFEKVHVIFDGVAGFGSSFLEEAFGGLVREAGMSKSFLDKSLIISTDDPDLEDYVLLAKRYIEEELRRRSNDVSK